VHVLVFINYCASVFEIINIFLVLLTCNFMA